MSALRRLRRTRDLLLAAAAARALLWGAATAMLAALALGAAGMHAPLAPVGVGAVVAGTLLWRGRRVLSAGSVALWIEERTPALDYALVTLADPHFRGDGAALERAVGTARWDQAVRGSLLSALAPPLALVLGVTAALHLSGSEAEHGVLPALRGAGGFRAAPAAPASALAAITARVAPPPYTALPSVEIDDPTTVAAIVGSRLTLSGRSARAPVRATLDGASLNVDTADGRWRVGLPMPERPAALRLASEEDERLVLLEPYPDSLPAVALTLPARDTVFRRAGGRLPVRAEARDDFGLDAVWLEYIVSSGGGEFFTFRSGVLGRADAQGRRTGAVAVDLALDSLELGPGDFVHVRAVARDRNRLTGPGIGFSETRTLRIARSHEYDSVAVDAAPPPDADRSLLSQRMLIRMAESLQQRRPGLGREALVRESRAIAQDQARLRRQVGDIIFMRLGGEAEGEHAHGPGGHVHYHGDGHDHEGEDLPTEAELLRAAEAATRGAVEHAGHSHGDDTPIVALNRPLLEAYNAMWAASGELEIAEPGRALPHMHAALRAIQKARAAERLYLRGQMPLVVVDLARVRLAGPRPDALPASRTGSTALDAAARRRLDRFDAALDLLSTRPAAAVDSLLVLRLDLLHDAPAAARSLGDAAEHLRRGTDATEPLLSARRLLAGPVESRTGLPRWSGGD
jgi:hypothetical protein